MLSYLGIKSRFRRLDAVASCARLCSHLTDKKTWVAECNYRFYIPKSRELALDIIGPIVPSIAIIKNGCCVSTVTSHHFILYFLY